MDKLTKGETPKRTSARLSELRNKQAEQQAGPSSSQNKRRGSPNGRQKRQQEVENLVNEKKLQEEQPEKKKRVMRNELSEERPEKKKSSMRVQLDNTNKQRLDELTTILNARSVGDSMDWLSKFELKDLYELREKVGYEKGGQTIDWLLSMAPKRMSKLTQDLGFQNGGQTVDWLLPAETERLKEVTKELGFTETGQTVDCLLGMARCKPLLEVKNSLGFQDCRETIEWLLNQAQRNIAAIKNAESTPAPRPVLPSPMSVHRRFPLNRLGMPAFADTVPSSNPRLASYNYKPSNQMMAPNFNAAGHQFQVGEIYGSHDQFAANPQQNQFQTNGRGFQGNLVHAENQFSNWVAPKEESMQSSQARNSSNYNTVHGNGNQIQTPYSAQGHIQTPYSAQGHIQMPYSAQRVNQGHDINMNNEIMRRRMQEGYIGIQSQPQFPTEQGGKPASNGADQGPVSAQAFPGSLVPNAGMPNEIQVYNNSTAKNEVEAGTSSTHFVMSNNEGGILSSL